VTTPLGDAGVHFLVLDGPLEEPFAGLTGEETVVVSRDFVTADGTEFLNPLLGVREVGGNGGSRVLEPTPTAASTCGDKEKRFNLEEN